MNYAAGVSAVSGTAAEVSGAVCVSGASAAVSGAAFSAGVSAAVPSWGSSAAPDPASVSVFSEGLKKEEKNYAWQ